MTDAPDVTYHIAITRSADGGRAVIEWGGYGYLHELLTSIMQRSADYGWLIELPDLPLIPTPEELRERALRNVEVERLLRSTDRED